jgi:fucose permease
MAGGSDTAINASIIEMWSQNSAPFLNALHFTFGVGTIAAPIIAQPFLSSHEKRWHLTIAYSICASICILSAIVLIILFVYHKYKAEEESQTIELERRRSLSQEIIRESNRYELSPKLAFICLIIGCLLLATYVAMEMTHFSFLPTFAQYSANMSESSAADLVLIQLGLDLIISFRNF